MKAVRVRHEGMGEREGRGHATIDHGLKNKFNIIVTYLQLFVENTVTNILQ